MVLEYEYTMNWLVEELNNVVKMMMMDSKMKLLMMNQDHKLCMNEYSTNTDDVAVVEDDDKIVMHKMVQIEQQQHIVHQQMNIIELLDYSHCSDGNKNHKMKQKQVPMIPMDHHSTVVDNCENLSSL